MNLNAELKMGVTNAPSHLLDTQDPFQYLYASGLKKWWQKNVSGAVSDKARQEVYARDAEKRTIPSQSAIESELTKVKAKYSFNASTTASKLRQMVDSMTKEYDSLDAERAKRINAGDWSPATTLVRAKMSAINNWRAVIIDEVPKALSREKQSAVKNEAAPVFDKKDNTVSGEVKESQTKNPIPNFIEGVASTLNPKDPRNKKIIIAVGLIATATIIYFSTRK